MFDYLSIDGELAVDFVMRYETLQSDFEKVCKIVKIPYQPLPQVNKSIHRPYWEYYNELTHKIVANKYKKDIEYFGYEFGV